MDAGRRQRFEGKRDQPKGSSAAPPLTVSILSQNIIIIVNKDIIIIVNKDIILQVQNIIL
jgi:hypothetical protein